MTTALVLAGHGSHISPETAGFIWAQVDRLRTKRVADEITAAFWKEQPSFHTVLNSLQSDDITIIPVFTANGFFTQTVIPAEMGLDGEITYRDKRTIRYTQPLSEHPDVQDIVVQHIEKVFQSHALNRNDTAIAIIGHSTKRNGQSRKAAESQAERIRALNWVAEVETVFLDDTPSIKEIYRLTHAPNLIAVPYFLAMGSHATIDVPRELGLQIGKNSGGVNGRTVYYTPPLAANDIFQKAIIDLINDSRVTRHKEEAGSLWDCFPMMGADSLIQQVYSQGEFHFGDLRVTPAQVTVWGDNKIDIWIQNPSELREYIRKNPFRSLTTQTGLPGKWAVRAEQPQMLHAIVETIYPGAVAGWAAQQKGTLQVNSFEATIKRQRGSFRQLAELSQDHKEVIIRKLCTQCIRHPSWFYEKTLHDSIPCAEPCNHWLSAAMGNRP